MKVRLSSEEAYPVHNLSEQDYDTEVDAPEETIERWKAAIEAYDAVQREMDSALEVAYAKDREK